MFTPIALNVNYLNILSLKIRTINASKTTITIEKGTQYVKERSLISAKQSFASDVGVVVRVSVEVACFFLNFIFCSFTALKHGSQS